MYRVENKQATEFKNVKMYVGDPWSPPVDGKIRNISVTDGAEGKTGYDCAAVCMRFFWFELYH